LVAVAFSAITPALGTGSCQSNQIGDTPPRRRQVERRENRTHAVRVACWADAGALCPEATTANHIRQCLHRHRDELSVDCREALAAPR